MLLLLFDIDGTLLLRGAADAHRDAMFEALVHVHGIELPSEHGVPVAGRTDPEIARAILLRAGVSAEEIDARWPEVREAIVEAYARLCPDDLRAYVPDGIDELLDRLAQRDDVRLSLLTGNLEPVARLKLKRAGLGDFFARGQGAFGSDDEDRAALPAIARRRAAGNGEPHPRERTVVIGDTPRDIACARADGVRCIAVTTGRYGAAELSGADSVADDAAELERALTKLV
jgi:phosphoglycolate phosphatase-like HAD superfamily hydrolase